MSPENISNNSHAPPSRGYSELSRPGKPTVKGASTHTNVIIKTRLPARGVVSSNPKRVDRLLERASKDGLLTDIKEHTNAGWGITIYTAAYRGVEIFVAGVPMGAAGSGFAFFEMFAAGAQAILRYGSNDRQVALDNLRDIIVVDRADNLISLPYGAGVAHVDPYEVIEASDELVDLFEIKAAEAGLAIKKMICHNVEDYHAFNFNLFFDDGESIREQIASLEGDIARLDCWDMETAALFWRAKQFGLHAATVLQNLYKKPGTSPYEGEHGKISLAMESTFYHIVLEVLHDFKPVGRPEGEPLPQPHHLERALRRHRSQDLIGTEEPLVGRAQSRTLK